MSKVTFDRPSLQAHGFGGFVTFDDLWSIWIDALPREAGVYAVLRDVVVAPEFLSSNPGGRFKGQDPTVPVDVLAVKWIDGAHVVYLGKGDNLRRRLKQFAQFGRGEPIGHWGGRYIWQLADAAELLVCWKRCEPEVSARALETELLDGFVAQHNALPFANITR